MKQIHLIYSIVLSVMLCIAGICLMVACVGIYRSGDQPFSRQSVAAAFSPIAVPVLLCLGLIIIGFLLDLFLPKNGKKSTFVLQYSEVLQRLRAKADLENADTALRSDILTLRKRRKRDKCISAALLCIGSITFLSYVLSGDRFHAADINDSIAKAVLVMLPCMAVPFVWSVVAAYRGRTSIKKEIDLLKQLPACSAEIDTAAKGCDRSILIARCLLLCVGTAFLLYGLFQGGTADVLTKAINICTECVGLG